MKKVRVAAHEAHRAAIVSALQDTGILEVRAIDEPGKHPAIVGNLEEEIRTAALRLENLERCLALAERFRPPRRMAERISQPLVPVGAEEVNRLRRETDVGPIYAECARIETDLSQARSVREDSTAKIESLLPWKAMSVSLDDLDTTGHVRFLPIVTTTSAVEEVEQDLAVSGIAHLVHPISSTAKTLYALIGFWRDSEEEALRILTARGVRPLRFPVTDKPPAAAIANLEAARTEAAQREIESRNRAEAFAREWYDRLAILVDDAATTFAMCEVERSFAYTERTFCMEGWVPEKELPRLEATLASVGPETHLTVEDPEPDDSVPVVFDNRPAFRPLEMIMTLYGRPMYGTLDAVPYFSPFFIIFFGLCVGDAGYGTVIILTCLFALRKLRLPPGSLRDTVVIGLYGGVTTFIVGALTGSWFGIPSEYLPRAMRGFINSVEEPMTMLYIALGFGVVQILFGKSIKMALNLYNKHWVEAICDDLLWILFIITLVPLCYKSIFAERVPPSVFSIASKTALVLAILLILTQGRTQKNVILKLLSGTLKLYDTVGIFGDVLSYSRLLALGLSGAAIASAFNGIAMMTKSLPYGIAYITIPVILVGGHTFNLVMNCLGGFIHSARLQYLEFFSKFFEPGGRMFRPLKRAEKYSTVIRRSI
jgi:V/A-type H+-transporting ATPase subunit I